jgi:hypothetical protein
LTRGQNQITYDIRLRITPDSQTRQPSGEIGLDGKEFSICKTCWSAAPAKHIEPKEGRATQSKLLRFFLSVSQK